MAMGKVQLKTEKVWRLAIDRGMDWKDVANAAGVKQQTLGAMLRGHGCRPSTLKQIADVFDVMPSEICDFVLKKEKRVAT